MPGPLVNEVPSQLVKHPIVPNIHSKNSTSLPANNLALQVELVDENPITQPESVPFRPQDLVANSSGFHATPNTKLQEPSAGEISNLNSVLRGRKRKAEDSLAKPVKKNRSKDTENADMKERARKPTMSGHVPLMPTHLAEAGYQVEKKGVRGTGRKVQPTKKPKLNGYAKKPASKGVPPKKNIK